MSDSIIQALKDQREAKREQQYSDYRDLLETSLASSLDGKAQARLGKLADDLGLSVEAIEMDLTALRDRDRLAATITALPAVVISTHQTEDVSALCDRVLVIDTGRICFDGTVPELLATAVGRVHVGPSANAGAAQTWKTGTGLIRSVGGQPAPDSSALDPSVEDAYLLLRTDRHTSQGVTP